MLIDIATAFRTRLFPTPAQEVALKRAITIYKASFNHGLCEWQSRHAKGQKPSALQVRAELAKYKASAEGGYLYGAPCCVGQEAVAHLGQAFKNFFDSVKGIRKGPKVRYPKFKSHVLRSGDSFPLTNTNVRVVKEENNGKTKAWVDAKADIGRIKAGRDLPKMAGRIMNATISYRCGKWFVSFGLRKAIEEPAVPTGPALGIDVGIKSFAVASDGTVIPALNPFRTAQRRLSRLQRRVTKRMKKGSKNSQKVMARISKLHLRVACLRENLTHQASTQLISKAPQAVVVEDLNVNGMLRNRSVSKAVSDQGWGKFLSQLEYKAARRRTAFVKAPRFYASSQLCSSCGCLNTQMKALAKRTLFCGDCGISIDRDLNAARNLVKLSAGVATPEIKVLPPTRGEKIKAARARKMAAN